MAPAISPSTATTPRSPAPRAAVIASRCAGKSVESHAVAPTATSRPSTVPRTPSPGESTTCAAAGNAMPRFAAASTVLRARWCPEPTSTAAARRSTSASAQVPYASTATTSGRPSVSVPVLSNTAVLTLARRSSAPPLRTMTWCRAARLMPPMIATGVASSSGQGVATTRTASTRSGSCVTNQASVHTASVSGVNQMAYWSAIRWMGDFSDCAVRTSSTMRAYSDSLARRVARTTMAPSRFTAPDRTSLPACTISGGASPVSRDTSRCDRPLCTTPSAGSISPGRTSSRSPIAMPSAGMSSYCSSARWRCAVRGAASSSARTALDARPSA